MNIYDYIHDTTVGQRQAHADIQIPSNAFAKTQENGDGGHSPLPDKHDRLNIESTHAGALALQETLLKDSDYSYIAKCDCGYCPACNRKEVEHSAAQGATNSADTKPNENEMAEMAENFSKRTNELTEAEIQELEQMRRGAIRDFLITSRLTIL